MPNWCYNNMLVAGNKKELRLFVKAIKKSETGDPLEKLDDTYDLNKLVPLDFNDAHSTDTLWGTKWGACSVSIDDEKAYPLHVRYESAWTPARNLIINISKQFPNLAFAVSFDEEGHDYCGWELIANGELVESGKVDTQHYPEYLQKIYDACDDSDSDWDDFHEAHSEWRGNNEYRMYQDSETCLNEYLVWKKKADRQRKEGRYVETFIPSV